MAFLKHRRAQVSGGLTVAALVIRVLREPIAYLAVVVALTVAGFVVVGRINSNASRIERNERELEGLLVSHRRALFGSCQRVNTLRRNGNLANVQRYRDDLLAAKLLSEQPRARMAFSARAKRIQWIPLTDCYTAVDRPQQFKAPTPRFVWRTSAGQIPR